MRLAVYDLDGTLLRVDSHALLLGSLALRAEMPWTLRASIAEGAVAWALRRIDDDATKRLAARALDGLTDAEARDHLAPLTARIVRHGLRAEVLERLRVDRAEGFTTLLLSASLDVPVAMFAEALGFDHHAGTPIERVEGRLTRRLAGPCLRGDAKARFVEAFAAQHRVDLARARAYGDRESDLPVLALAGEPFAVHPDRALRRTASARSWPILDR